MNEKEKNRSDVWKRARVFLWSTTMRRVANAVVNGEKPFPNPAERITNKLKTTRKALNTFFFRDSSGGKSREPLVVTEAAMNRLIDSEDNPAAGWIKYESGNAVTIGDKRVDAVDAYLPGARQLWSVGPGFPLWAILGWDASAKNLWLPVVQRAIMDPGWSRVVSSYIAKAEDCHNTKGLRLRHGDDISYKRLPSGKRELVFPIYSDPLKIAISLARLSADAWLDLAVESLGASQRWLSDETVSLLSKWTAAKAQVELDQKEGRVTPSDVLATAANPYEPDEIWGKAKQAYDSYSRDHISAVKEALKKANEVFDEPFHPCIDSPLDAYDLMILAALTSIGNGSDRGEHYRWNEDHADDTLMQRFADMVWPKLYFLGEKHGMTEAVNVWRRQLVEGYLHRNAYTEMPSFLLKSFGSFEMALKSLEPPMLPGNLIVVSNPDDPSDVAVIAFQEFQARAALEAKVKAPKARKMAAKKKPVEKPLGWQQTRTKIWSRSMRKAAEHLINGEAYASYLPDEDRKEPLALRNALFKGVTPGREPREGGRILVKAAAMDRFLGDEESRLWRKYEDGKVGQVSDEIIDRINRFIPGARRLWDVGPDAFPLWSLLALNTTADELWRPMIETAIHDHRWVYAALMAKGEEPIDPVNMLPVTRSIKLSIDGHKKREGVHEWAAVTVPDVPSAHIDELAESLAKWTSDGWSQLANLCANPEHLDPIFRRASVSILDDGRKKLAQAQEMRGVIGETALRIDEYRPPHSPPMREAQFTGSDLTVIAALTVMSTNVRGELYQWNAFYAYDALIRRFVESTVPALWTYAFEHDLTDVVTGWCQQILNIYVEKTGKESLPKDVVKMMRAPREPQAT
ncbi:hypothetical protein OVY01_22525 [Robbsia sp. Bb-Pol-6]|uniref:Type I-U CRISPR-associated protein Csx17 n=1 Tax=Robbsia betulipollinis TaxID=2981849 RepID=A0ABT3ZTR7_9BURK|nr:hypothetical protein [Robbsia betulipollinis]MCY0389918.1 hypothetical protein [Robbsia betulipollinis]